MLHGLDELLEEDSLLQKDPQRQHQRQNHQLGVEQDDHSRVV
jgi:hypothetical protein